MISPDLRSPDSNAALLERFVSMGEQSAFREIVERHVGMVLAVAGRHTGDEASAQDVAQRVFALLVRKAPALRRHPSLTGWIFTACRLECRAHHRDTARRARLMKDYADHHAHTLSQEPSLFPAGCLDEALEQLADADRELLLCRYYEGNSFSDIARARKVSEPAARKQLSRAIGRLAGVMGSRGTAPVSAVTPAILGPAMASAYPSSPPPLPWRGTGALAEAALKSSLLLPALALPLSMTAKTTLVTGAALLWIASLAAGWQAGVHSNTTTLQPGNLAPATPPRPQVSPADSRQQPPGGTSRRTIHLRELIERIAEDLEASPWDAMAKIRATARMNALSDADAAEALAVTMDLPDPPAKLLAMLWSRRGRLDGPAALKDVAQLPPALMLAARSSILEGWAETDPAAAFQWIQSHKEPLLRGVVGFFQSWSSKDPAAALSAASTLTDPAQRTAALGSWCRTAVDATQRSALMEAILASPETSRDELLAEAAVQWHDDCPAYAAWLGGHQELEKYGFRPLQALCGIWAASDPSAAAAWLGQNLAGQPAYPELLRSIIDSWAMVDAPRASEWLAAQSAGPQMDPSIIALISLLPPNEAPAIVAWAARLHDRKRAASILQMRQLKPAPSTP